MCRMLNSLEWSKNVIGFEDYEQDCRYSISISLYSLKVPYNVIPKKYTENNVFQINGINGIHPTVCSFS